MKSLHIHKTKSLKGQIGIPGDKSISHRAVMLGAVARGETVVNNFLPSADCLATVECFRRMGIEIKVKGMRCEVRGKGLKGLKAPNKMLNVGNSGTTIRLASGIIAGQNFEVKITGDESIEKRPMGRIAKPLRLMGASIEGVLKNNEIYAPLKIIGGNLKPIEYELPVASAQVKSAVLLAGLFADGKTCVIERMPSRDHTERLLEHFGAGFDRAGERASIVGNCEFAGAEIDIPGDISSAAFFLVAALLTPDSELHLLNVGLNPTRTGIIDVLHRMGAAIEIPRERVLSAEPRADIIVRSSELRSVELNGEIIPRIIDEIPVIAVAATQAEGVTEIRGAKELRIKESDRIKTIASELRKLGAKIEELEDGLRIEGPTKLKGAILQSYGDHRIAMAMAIAGLVAEGETTIENTECIETSFPGFEPLLKELR
ncbi:MAG: 3-phosphoshikimate 1-carboxyvinyltransferase [Candidatus Margulisbacteria bacterium]|nr:3-phosphoshikimate 1-carboxyvinyltransferase [Candidatus Margulisiibacteriota bacterium]